MLQITKERTKPDFTRKQQIAGTITDYRCPCCRRLLFKRYGNESLSEQRNNRYSLNPADDYSTRDGMERQKWRQKIEIKCPKCGKIVIF